MSKIRKVVAIIVLICFVVGVYGYTKKQIYSKKEEPVQYEKIVVGSDRYEPYIYLDDNGEFSGIDVELATEAFRRMGYEPEFKCILWENKKEELDLGNVDCLWGCFSMNEREDEYQWAGPYLFSRQVVVVRVNSSIHDISDLNGKDVAVQETSKPEEYLLHSTSSETPRPEKVYCFSSIDEVCAALRKNYVDAICGHESTLNRFIETAPDEYRILDEELFVSRLGVAFAKDFDSDFVKRLDQTLQEMREDGTTSEIVEKYGLNEPKNLEERD